MADDKPKNADFIGRVVKDAKNPVETRMLSGWFGESGEKGYRRLYTDAELTSYVDIPDDAILYTEAIKDSQPAGGVLVWIKRDASVQSGGSAASRAGRYLQGQVAADFGAPGSVEKAGLRCVTEVPCGEPTGFTGQCTKQPNVGGAWPCITAVPHCVEVTGFTGKCTHAPWPNPTRYIGCTILHCPTNDLTHIPYICNIVASGQPGCVVVNPPQGGDAAAETEKVAETALPGCGYTKSWGLCQTHLLGCGYTGGFCPTNPQICDPVAPQANAAARKAVVPTPAAPCISPTPCSDFVICNFTAPPTQLCSPAPKICETFCGPNCQTKQLEPVCTSVNCVTPATQHCPPPPPTPQLECTMVCTRIGPQCAVGVTVPAVACNNPNVAAPQAFAAPADTMMGWTCTLCPTNPVFCDPGGPQALAAPQAAQPACAAGTAHPTLWTQIGCPTSLLGCGYTHNWGYHCPPPLSAPPHCPLPTGFNCPSQICHTLGCQSQACQPGGGVEQQQFAQHGLPQTLATVCTQFGCQQTHQLGCPTRGIDCTVICPTHHLPQCPTAPATICPTHLPALCPPPLSAPPHCPLPTGFNCPSAICPQSIACVSQACQPGGGGQQQQFAGPNTVQNTMCCITTWCSVICEAPQAAGRAPQAMADGPTFFYCGSVGCSLFGCQQPAAVPQSHACQPGGGGQQQQFPQTLAATVCTQFAPCHTQPPGDCTFFGGCQPPNSGVPCQTFIPTCYVCTGNPCHTLYLRCPILP